MTLRDWVGMVSPAIALAGVIGTAYIVKDQAARAETRVEGVSQDFSLLRIEEARRAAEFQATKNEVQDTKRKVELIIFALEKVERKLDRVCQALRPRCSGD